MAQDTGSEAQDDPGDVIVVTGIRGSLKEARDIKRDAANSVDAISAEDIGKFPDENVAESLQRIPGVQITRARGEGQNASVRGLPSAFVHVQLNNVQIPNATRDEVVDAGASRSFDFSVLPSEFVRTLEVHKTPTASLQEGGLAGTVIVRTPRPFDIGKQVFSLSAQVSNESNSDKGSPKATAFYSNVFADGSLGVSLGVTASRRYVFTQSYGSFGLVSRTEAQGFLSGASQQFGAFTGAGLDAAANAATCDGSVASRASCFGQDWNGNGVLDDFTARFPSRESFNFIDEKRDRISAIGSLQWQANDNLEFFADGYYSKLNNTAALQESLSFVQFALGPFFPDESEITTLLDGTQGFTTFRADNVDLRHGNRIEQRKSETYSFTGGGKWEGNGWDVNAEFSYAKSTNTANDLNLVTRSFYDLLDVATFGAETPAVSFLNGTEAILTDPNLAQLIGVNGPYQQPSSGTLYDFQFNVSKELDWNGIKALKFGAQYSDDATFGGSTFLSIPLSGLVSLYGDQGPATALENQVGFTGTQSGAAFLLPVKAQVGGFLDGQYPSARLIGDTAGLYAGFTPAQLIAAGTFSNNLNQTVDVTERVASMFAQLDFESDDDAISGNFGVRVVNTKQISRGVGADLNTITFTTNGNVTNLTSLGNISVSRSYTEVLPSLNVKFNASDNLVLRAAASRTLSRPTLQAISTVTNADFAGGAVITGGNPFLDPFISNNFDVGVEYYFGTSNLLSLTYFRKDLQTIIRQGTDKVTLPVQFLDQNGNVSRTDNVEFTDTSPSNGRGVKIQGFEAGYSQTFDDGIFKNTGFNINYTFVDNSDVESLPGASKHNINVGAFYEDDRLGVQLSYTWRDKFVNEIARFGNTNTEVKAFGTLDGGINFKVNDAISVFAEGNNLLDARFQETFVNGLARQVLDSGRRLTIGARATF